MVMVPLLQGDVVRQLDILKNLFQPCRDGIVNGLVPIFHNEYQVIMKREHRMIIILQNHCSTPPLLSNIGHTENEGRMQGAQFLSLLKSWERNC